MDNNVFINAHDLANTIGCLRYYMVREGSGCTDTYWIDRNSVLGLIFGAPPECTIAVNYGKWNHDGGDEWNCSVCGNIIHTEGSWEKLTYKYCPKCGARMEIKDGQSL